MFPALSRSSNPGFCITLIVGVQGGGSTVVQAYTVVTEVVTVLMGVVVSVAWTCNAKVSRQIRTPITL